MNKRLFSSLTVALSVCCIAGAVEITRNSSNGLISGVLFNKSQRNGPDERILWDLYHAKKYKQLTHQIDQLREQFPSWRPPNDLLIALLDLQRGGQEASKPAHSRSTSAAIKKIYSSRKKIMAVHNGCGNLQARWNWADYQLKRNHTDKALDIYKHIIVQCPAKNKMETLEKVRAELDYVDFVELIDLSNDYLPALYLDRLKYDALKDKYVTSTEINTDENEQIVSQASYFLDFLKDSDFATAIGWRYFDLHDYQKAQNWFKKALDWSPANSNAENGYALSLEKNGEFDKALATYSTSKHPSKEIKAVATRVLKAKAWKNFDSKNLPQAAKNTSEAEKISGSDPEIQELNAWISKESNQNEKSAKLFDELYQQSPTRKYARAYIESQSKVDRSDLADKAKQKDGVLQDEYKQYHGKELYERKQFQSAYKLAPKAYPKLENIDSPWVDLGGYVRYKSGENGMGRLDLFKAPVATGSYTVDGNHNFQLGLSRVQLYSGSPTKCVSPVGTLTPTGQLISTCGTGTQFSPTQQLNDAFEVDFLYRKDGWFSPYVKLGTTPIDGVIDPTITFDAGFFQQTEYGNWGLAAYSQPVRQSILSYTGIKDPYNPQTLEWGRVLRTGFRPTLFYRFNDNWNASGTVDLALLEGKNVAQNTTVAASVSVARNLHLPGFDYFNVGPSFNYEHFNKNLSHFTYGHGGYFSPEHYYNIGAGVNFLTEEGQPYIIKGRLIAGFQGIKEASAPWFPLGNFANGTYAGSHRSGEALDFELKGAWLINPNFQLGAGAAVRKTNGYEDYTGGLFLRYYFDQRKASFSTDLPDNMFSNIY